MNDLGFRVYTVNEEDKIEEIWVSSLETYQTLNPMCILSTDYGYKKDLEQRIGFGDAINLIHEEHGLSSEISCFGESLGLKSPEELAYSYETESEPSFLTHQPTFIYGDNLVKFQSDAEEREFRKLYEGDYSSLSLQRKPKTNLYK